MPFSTLPPILAESLAGRGYSEATPVQAAVLQPEAAGRDLIVSAQTGSGKTVAFGLAMAPELLAALVKPDRLLERHLASFEPAHDILQRLQRVFEAHRGDVGALCFHARGVARMEARVKRGPRGVGAV